MKKEFDKRINRGQRFRPSVESAGVSVKLFKTGLDQPRNWYHGYGPRQFTMISAHFLPLRIAGPEEGGTVSIDAL